MAQKSKFINQVVFIDDDYYRREHNTSYYFIVDVTKEDNISILIDAITMKGDVIKMFMGPSSMYKKLELLDLTNIPHLAQEFIEGVFNV
jgi:hypothetical protein